MIIPDKDSRRYLGKKQKSCKSCAFLEGSRKHGLFQDIVCKYPLSATKEIQGGERVVNLWKEPFGRVESLVKGGFAGGK